MRPRHAAILTLLALAGANAAAQAPTQKDTDPLAGSLEYRQPAGKPKYPIGDCGKVSWPREAMRYELVGVATVGYKLLPDGSVSDARVIKSSGWGILDDATIALANGCKYTPQQAAEAAGRELPLQFVWTLDSRPRVFAGLVPGSCGGAGRFAGFAAFDLQFTDEKGVKVRFLLDQAGAPRALKVEGASVSSELAGEVAAYLANCRFAFDPAAGAGKRSDAMWGSVLLR
jgi:TonB family protein